MQLKSLPLQRNVEGWYTLDFNPRSTLMVAAGCEDHKARMLDTDSGAETAVFHSHEGPLTGVTVCTLDAVPYLVTCAMDGAALLWNLAFLTGPARHFSLHAKVEKRPLKVVARLDVPLSCLTVAEVFGALRVMVGCYDSGTWMWTVEAKSVMNQETWCVSRHSAFESEQTERARLGEPR